MRSTRWLLAFAAGALLLAWRVTERPTASRTANTDAGKQLHAPADGYAVHRDPKTGALREPTTAELAAAQNAHAAQATSSSAEGLQAMQSPVPGGGMVMRLDGRFHSTMVATRHDDATPTVECLDAVGSDDQQKEASQ